MILRQVGEDSRMDLKTKEPAQLEGVGGGFDTGEGAMVTLELGQESHQIQGFRRGVDRRNSLVADAVLDCA